MAEIANANQATGRSSPATGRPLHVLHVVRKGFAGGGMENGIINIANGLPPELFRVSVCALDKHETFSQRMQNPNSEFHLLPKCGEGIDWLLIVRLNRLLRRMKVDIVHSHNWGTFLYAVLAAKLAGIPIIHGEHGKNIGEVEGDSIVKRGVKSFLAPRVDRLITVSRELAREWEHLGVRHANLQHIPNGVDSDRFHPRSLEQRRLQRQRFGLPENALLIGSVGRLDELKNYGVLVQAFARLVPEFPNAHLALLGDGPCHDPLAAAAERNGDVSRVHLLGHHPDADNFLASLDIFALPSLSEGMSNVLLEAMASGLPVVCADVPCHREVFDPELEGVIVSPCTPESLAITLCALLRDQDRRQSLGVAARGKVLQRFSLSTMVARYQELYLSMFSKSETAFITMRREVL